VAASSILDCKTRRPEFCPVAQTATAAVRKERAQSWTSSPQSRVRTPQRRPREPQCGIPPSILGRGACNAHGEGRAAEILDFTPWFEASSTAASAHLRAILAEVSPQVP
jgi:hypothetical protein